jgi:mannitol-1-/sugar-/sorbitol-6-/2-deoxyglucose-6-phosphatase
MFEGVIYDLDGVMLDSHAWQAESWLKYLAKFENTGISPEDIRDLIGKRAYDIAEYLYRRYNLPEDPLTLHEGQQEILNEMVFDCAELQPGSLSTLQMFKDYNFKIAVTSANPRDFVWNVLEKFEIDEVFDVVVAGDMVPESRPSPMQLNACAETFAMHPSYCLVLEQTRQGIEAARNASMRVICVLGQDMPRWKAGSADLVLPNLDQLTLHAVRNLYIEGDSIYQLQPQLQRSGK